jgi:hypothetical protein
VDGCKESTDIVLKPGAHDAVDDRLIISHIPVSEDALWDFLSSGKVSREQPSQREKKIPTVGARYLIHWT